MSELLNEEELSAELKRRPEWEVEGNAITRTIEFEEFQESIDFVNELAEMAEDAQHYPDFNVSFNRVCVILTTDDEGGVTAVDIEMAQRIDRLVD